jgi:hypothetical protein
MLEKLEIDKKQDKLEICVKLKKKTGRRVPVSSFSWKKAKKILEDKYPDHIIGEPIVKGRVLKNTGPTLEGTWIFPYSLKEKQVETKKVTKKTIKKTKRVEEKKSLTKADDSATVDETKQSTELLIVQEPTE